MLYEVEMKFQVGDVSSFLHLLAKFDVRLGDSVEEQDFFYQHPSRDFAKTDEGLRIRHRNGEYRITYKGPKIDSLTKTRQEIELPLHCSAETAREWDALLLALGFRQAGIVRKSRRSAKWHHGNRDFSITLDHLESLGDFVEIETTAADSDLDCARESLLQLAKMLDLSENIRTSYLEMVLERK